MYCLWFVYTGVPSVWAVDIGRQLWRAPGPLVAPPDQESVTLINQLSHCPALDSFVMTTYDHSILLAHTSSMEVWKQVGKYYFNDAKPMLFH